MIKRCPKVVKKSPEEARRFFRSDSELVQFRDTLRCFRVTLEVFKRYTGLI